MSAVHAVNVVSPVPAGAGLQAGRQGRLLRGVQVSEGVEQMVVEMNRTRGDPVLFVKPLAGGYQPGFLPSVLDFANYSDRCWAVPHLPAQPALPGVERACAARPGTPQAGQQRACTCSPAAPPESVCQEVMMHCGSAPAECGRR